ncbi:hypothetical protein KFZ70_02480 [Tamlana fucoidanivorans]|uniref:Uncharacterized protein n=1 Tax=Allotamlana fucoidanivorans TaxID=2583814 RepID=A0A5C4SBA6_9FLAO|nr:hypothetical protein [Tamlana fucoidanivorans]TNJ40850.1 hypothetical protein FGF67_16745 [Tamlana fucoidanivorans]
MNQLYNIIVKQLIIGYIGAFLLLIYYKIKGRKITYEQILDEIDPKSGIKKYYYKAFYLGVGFLILIVLAISTLAGVNPKLYDPNE